MPATDTMSGGGELKERLRRLDISLPMQTLFLTSRISQSHTLMFSVGQPTRQASWSLSGLMATAAFPALKLHYPDKHAGRGVGVHAVVRPQNLTMTEIEEFIDRYKDAEFRHRDALLSCLRARECLLHSSPRSNPSPVSADHLLKIYRIRAEDLVQFRSTQAENLREETLAFCDVFEKNFI